MCAPPNVCRFRKQGSVHQATRPKPTIAFRCAGRDPQARTMPEWLYAERLLLHRDAQALTLGRGSDPEINRHQMSHYALSSLAASEQPS
jgi:hypothetical protein